MTGRKESRIMLVVYANYVQRMETIADEIENDFNRADDMNEIDCYLDEAIEKLQSIYWEACDDGLIKQKELNKLEDLKRYCIADVRDAYKNYTGGLETDIFAPDSNYDI